MQDIAAKIGIEATNASKHLALLFDNGVVASRRDANRIYYRVSDVVIQKVIELVCDMALPSSSAKRIYLSWENSAPSSLGLVATARSAL